MFLDRLKDHAMGIFSSAILIGCTPGFLKPVTGLMASFFCKYFFNRAAKICLPFVKERLAQVAKLKSDPKYDWTPPVSLSYFLRRDLDLSNYA